MSEVSGPQNAIRGVTDLQQLPRVGKIRLGVKRQTSRGKEAPANVSHFVVPPEVGAALGDERPTVLTVLLPTDSPEEWWLTNLRQYRSGGLVCRGDGYQAVAFVDVAKWDRGTAPSREGASRHAYDVHTSGEPWIRGGTDARAGWRPIRCYGSGYNGDPPCPAYGERCSESATLLVILPNVPGAGVWQIDTGSYHSIVQIGNALRMFAAATGGRLAGIPFELRRVARTVNREGRRTEVSIVELHYAGDWRDLMAHRPEASARQLAAPVVDVDEPPDDAPANGEAAEAGPSLPDLAESPAGVEALVAWATSELELPNAETVFSLLGVGDAEGALRRGVVACRDWLRAAWDERVVIPPSPDEPWVALETWGVDTHALAPDKLYRLLGVEPRTGDPERLRHAAALLVWANAEHGLTRHQTYAALGVEGAGEFGEDWSPGEARETVRRAAAAAEAGA